VSDMRAARQFSARLDAGIGIAAEFDNGQAC
jgi:hypothetical protein